MKKHVRKIIALLLVISLFPVLPASVFAEEADGSTIPEGATRHTIELTIEPGEALDPSDDSGVAPYIWNQGTYNPPTNGATYTAQFYIPERYFAYEVSATGNGSGNYNIRLLISDAETAITSDTYTINGGTFKKDWISVSPGNHLFKISNTNNFAISVTITYYSWA